MYKLVSLSLTNFISFEKATVDFSSPGLWTITGFNQRGLDSNGAGKSAILAGIVWVLFGRTQNGLSGKDIIRWGCSSCGGLLKLQQDIHIYEIARSSTSIDFFIDGQKQVGHKKDIQDIINKTFGTNYDLFLTFNIFTRDWSKFLTNYGDKNRKQLFKSILMLDQLDTALENAKNISATLHIQANKSEGTIKQILNTLPELEEILNKNKELETNDTKIKEETIKELEKQKETLRPELADFSDALNNINSELDDFEKIKINEKIEYAGIKLTNINNLIYYDQATIVDLEDKLKKAALIGGICPTCGQKILAKNKTMHTRHLEILLQDCKESLKSNETEKETINKELYGNEIIQKKIVELKKEKSHIEQQVYEQSFKLDKYNDFCKMADKSLADLKTKQTNYAQLISITQAKIDKLKIAQEHQQALFDGYLKEIDYFAYLQWLFSRKGVINLIVEKCFARLAYLSNRYLRKLSGEFKLEISAQKELKSGDYKDEIDIFVWNQGTKIPFVSLSSGQQQRMNIAILLALYDWGREIGVNSFDFMILDEIMDLSLAEKGQEETLDLLYSKKSAINHIILISHKNILKSQFDKEINVIRDGNGISKIS